MTDTSEVVLNDDELYFIGAGIVATSVCVPAAWEAQQIEAATNCKSPTGIDSRWSIADDDFATGQKNGCDCNQVAGRRHWLLVC